MYYSIMKPWFRRAARNLSVLPAARRDLATIGGGRHVPDNGSELQLDRMRRKEPQA